MSYKTVIENIKTRRKNDLLLAERIFVNALLEYPELRELEREIKSLTLQSAEGVDTQKIKTDAKKIKELTAKKDVFLKSVGLTTEILNPPPRCTKCGDTGTVDGKICPCVISGVAAATVSEISFDDFDLSVFAESDKTSAKYAFDIMRSFCDKFPSVKKLNFVLTGKPGSGKTFLASCVADAFSKNGFSAVLVSAFGFLNRTLAYHTAPAAEKLWHIAPLIDCDLLIIDDLGTENMLKNVTVEYFYNILNERMAAGRHTLITTNLDDNMIAARYGDRAASRLLDQRLSLWLALAEKDLRKRGKFA